MTDATFSNLKVQRATAGAVEDLLTLDSVDATDGNGAALSFINNSAVAGLYVALGRLSASRVDSQTVRLDLGVSNNPSASSGDDVPPLLSLVSGATGLRVTTAPTSLLAVGGALTAAGATTLSGTLSVAGATNLNGGLRVSGNLDVTGTVDGRDISSDGARLDQHLANTTNPHNTTATQVGALPLGGGSISGSLNVAGATTVSSLRVTNATTLDGALTVGGNVGIGTSQPGARLEVQGGSLRIATNSGPELNFGDEAGAAVLRVAHSGPQSLGAINLGNATQNWQMRVDGSDGHKFKLYDATRVSDALVIDRQGNVGIGQSAPQAKLHVSGGDIIWGNSRLNSDQGGSIDLGGDPTQAGTGTPYIDFHFNGLTQDFNTRIINDADGQLSVQASVLNVAATLALAAMPGGGTRTLIWNDGTWLRLNQNLDYTKPVFGVHTPGVLGPDSLNVGGINGWGDPGKGNVWIAGSVGVGLANPAYALHLAANRSLRLELGTNQKLSLGGDGTLEVDAPGVVGGRLIVANNGNVGIGIAAPREKLHVAGTVAIGGNLTVGAGSSGSIKVRHIDGKHYLNDGNNPLYLNWGTSQPVVLGFGNNTESSLLVSGNVGIGTQAPQQKLHVAGAFVRIDGAGNEQAYIGGDGSGGDVQIGSFRAGVNVVGLWNGATGSWMDLNCRQVNPRSSIEYKQDVDTLVLDHALEALPQLRAVTFSYKDEPDQPQIGFIAEEMPEGIATDNRKSLNVIAIVGVLTRVIQHQQEELVMLKQRIDAM